MFYVTDVENLLETDDFEEYIVFKLNNLLIYIPQ